MFLYRADERKQGDETLSLSAHVAIMAPPTETLSQCYKCLNGAILYFAFVLTV